METLWRDLQVAARGLRKKPGFAAVVVLTLALGIGANSAIFTVINGVLLRALPYPQAGRLVFLYRDYPGLSVNTHGAVSATKFLFWRDKGSMFEGVTAADLLGASMNLSVEGKEPEHVASLRVSSDFFRVLGVSPMLGRDFLPDDDRKGAEPVVILSYSLWRQSFNSDPSIIGHPVTLNGRSFTIIGIGSNRFEFPVSADAWTPLQISADSTDEANLFQVIARLKPGVSFEQARAGLGPLREEFHRTYPNLIGTSETIGMTDFRRMITGDVRPALLVLIGAVVFVLLIACANVANLLLARSATRQREIAVRTALGASLAQLVRQMLAESVLLALLGAIVGLALAVWGLPWLLSAAPGGLPLRSQISVDGRVLLFTLGVALIAGLIFGLAPALHAPRRNVYDVLKEGGTRATTGASGRRMRSALVVSEVALSLILLLGAALLLDSFWKLSHVPSGFEAHNVLTMQMSLGGERYNSTARIADFDHQLAERLERLPGVAAAASVTNLPLELGPDFPFDVMGRAPSANNSSGEAQWRHITPDYLRVMKIPLLSGRTFSETDQANSPAVAIINQAMAREFWPKENPIGQQILIGKVMGPRFADRTREIVGIIGDVREEGLNAPAPPTMFLPVTQVPESISILSTQLLPSSWVIRTSVPPMTIANEARREVLSLDGQLPAFHFRTMDDVLSASIAPQQFNMLLLLIFAGVALTLSAVGIYGVMAYAVSERFHEFGIRMALGAQRADVLRMVLRHGMGLAAIGIVLGVLGGAGVSRGLKSLLFGVSALNPVAFIAVSVFLALVAAAACYIPARRATRVDPLVALRYE